MTSTLISPREDASHRARWRSWLVVTAAVLLVAAFHVAVTDADHEHGELVVSLTEVSADVRADSAQSNRSPTASRSVSSPPRRCWWPP